MKGYYRNILIRSAVLLAAVGCTKTPEVIKPLADSTICLSATEAGTTKAMLDQTAFQKAGNRIQIYDFVDNSTTPYINDQIGPDVDGNNYGFDGVWPFVDGPHQWTPGVHKFFGWLAVDATTTSVINPATNLPYNTPAGFFGGTTAFNPNSWTYTIAPDNAGMHHNTPQFDFMYSNVVSTEPINTPVNLTFYHFFTAFSIGAVNQTTQDIIIHEFELINLYNSAQAKINFKDENGVSVSYSEYSQVYDYNGTTTPPEGSQISYDNQRLYRKSAEEYTLSSNGSVENVFTGTGTREYDLMWPQLYREQYPLGTMWVKYSYAGSQSVQTSVVSFPDMDWEAGKKYHFIVKFDKEPGSVVVDYIVAEWDDVVWDLEFEEPVHTMLLSTPNDNEAAPTGEPSIFYDNSDEKGEIGAFTGYFKMESPQGLAWKPTLTNASAGDYEVRVYTNKDANGNIHDDYDILVTSDNIEAEKDRYYKIVVVAKNPDNIGKVVKLGVSYAPLWNEEANPLLIINKGDYDGHYYKWTTDATDPDSNPDVCWVSIRQKENTTY